VTADLDLPTPPYGTRSLADLTPSLLASAGVPGEPNPLELEPCRGFCLLLIDGLGWEQVLAHREAAPVLAAMTDRSPPLSAVFPSTTSASLASLGTGLPPGEHGLVGYTVAIPGLDRPMNTLLWQLYGVGPHVELQDRVVPEAFQPNETVFERAERAGMDVAIIGPPAHEGSPLTRAIFRGGTFLGAYFDPDMRSAVAEALDAPRPAVYAYHPDFDTAGHVHGVGSESWLEQLARFDALVEGLAAALPADCALVVTGDHGMVNLEEKIDVADEPALMRGVRMLAGDARARQLHVASGAGPDVLATWTEVLGDRMWVVSRDQAVDEGWFGPTVTDVIRDRVGEVIAVASAPVGVVQRDVDPVYASLVCHHGSLTPAEQRVPLIEIRA
jgi:Type I phosphodiesterase / nucleotide pyrophosphatase